MTGLLAFAWGAPAVLVAAIVLFAARRDTRRTDRKPTCWLEDLTAGPVPDLSTPDTVAPLASALAATRTADRPGPRRNRWFA